MVVMPEKIANEPKTLWLCRTPQDEIIPAGSLICMPSMWTHNSIGLTKAIDVEIQLQCDTMAIDALALLESKALELLADDGGCELRDQSLIEIMFTGKTVLFYCED